ncbi:tRNA dihydrouridine synthase DusB [Fusibacter sp. JL298sf-3]
MNIREVVLKNDVVLAPMAGVTDLPFRTIVRDFHEGLMVTEMVSVSALYYNDRKTEKLMTITDGEQPMALQIFTKEPDKVEAVMDRLNAHNHEVLDINMGCPAPKIVNNGEGSALMKTPELAEAIIKAAVKTSKKPVTVKFRKGWDAASVNAVEFAKMAEAAGASAIAIHGRTRDQMYMGEADWSIIGACKRAVSIPVIGNGDVFSVDDAVKLKEETGCDGIMIGRGVQGNPWLMQAVAHYLKTGQRLPEPTPEEKLAVTLKHFEALRQFKGDHIATLEMRKHAAWYFKGLYGAARYKNLINKATSAEVVKALLKEAFLEG